MALRKVPGALALGLLASLLAHGGLYGGGHSMGGDYHSLLIQLALAGVVSLACFYGLLALDGARTTANGSVLAARLAERLPGFGLLFASATIWYAGAERLEPHHTGVAWIAVPLVIAAGSWLIQRCCRFALAALASAFIAVFGSLFAPRTPSWARFTLFARPVRRILWARRRFARPPPIEIGCCA